MVTAELSNAAVVTVVPPVVSNALLGIPNASTGAVVGTVTATAGADAVEFTKGCVEELRNMHPSSYHGDDAFNLETGFPDYVSDSDYWEH